MPDHNPQSCECYELGRQDQKEQSQKDIDRFYAMGYMQGRSDILSDIKWNNLDDWK